MNTQLEEEQSNEIDNLNEEIKSLNEELRKYQILQWTPKELEIELNKKIIFKQQLEKIKELVNSSKPFEYIVFQIHQVIKE